MNTSLVISRRNLGISAESEPWSRAAWSHFLIHKTMATFLHTPSTHPHMPSSALSLSTTPKKKAMDRCLEDVCIESLVLICLY